MPMAWSGALKQDTESVRLIVTDGVGNEVLKARLPSRSEHPRALLTLLEGVALYSGATVHVATSVGDDVGRASIDAVFGEQLMAMDSALVRFLFVMPRKRGRRLLGLGRFRDLRGLRQAEATW